MSEQNVEVNGSTPQSDEVNFNTLNVVSDFDTSRADSLEDLIPIELRKAFEENTTEGVVVKEEEKKIVDTTSKPKKEEVVAEDDIDLSPENIDKILKGEEITKEEEVVKPFWYEDDDYKELSSRLEAYGLKDEVIDKVLQKVADKYTVDNGKLVQGLEEQLIEAKKKADTLEAEQRRLRDMERGLLFDELPETKSKYGTPMIEAVQDIKGVLDREGAKVSVQQIINAKNKTELLTLIEGSNLSEKDVVRVVEQWRSYKDTETAYYAAKTEAKEKGIGAVTAKISDETVGTIFKNGLRSLLKSKDEYGYIDKAIQEGIDKHQEVGNVIGMGKTNAFSFIKALQNPTEHLHSQEWMEGLVKYTLDAAHNKHLASQLPKLQQKNTEQATLLKKVITEYKKLAAGAKGLNGSKSPGFVKGSESRRQDSESSVTKEDLEKLAKGDFTALLDGIPSLRN